MNKPKGDSISGECSAMKMLPEDIVINVLIRVPGKQLARFKCVCKSWRLLLKTYHFLKAYRSHRQLGLVVMRTEQVDPATVKDGNDTHHLFSYGGLRRLKEPKEDFIPLSGLVTRCRPNMSPVVNGLICISDDFRLTLYNVCTGQMMRIPNSEIPDMIGFVFYISQSYFGYDPSSRKYKLLRFLWLCNKHTSRIIDPSPRTAIMTLKPSISVPEWRDLNQSNSVRSPETFIIVPMAHYGYGSFHWLRKVSSSMFLISFDLGKENFQEIKLPQSLTDAINNNQEAIVTKSMGCLAVWMLPNIIDGSSPAESYTLFVLENEEDERWSEHCVKLPKELVKMKDIVVPMGNLPAGGKMLLMNALAKNQKSCLPVFSYDHTTKKFDPFTFGEFPDSGLVLVPAADKNLLNFPGLLNRISCLPDGNMLHLPLDDVLRGVVDSGDTKQ